MRTTGIRAFDNTLHTTNIWLSDLMELFHWEDKQRAYQALRIVLHAVRDHLPVDHAACLGAQLPMLVRGCYYEGWHPAGKPVKQRKLDGFLRQISENLPGGMENIDAGELVRGVLEILARHITAGEIDHVREALPGQFSSLWETKSQTVWS